MTHTLTEKDRRYLREACRNGVNPHAKLQGPDGMTHTFTLWAVRTKAGVFEGQPVGSESWYEVLEVVW